MASPRATARAHAVSVPAEWPNEREHRRKLADAINLICQTLGLNVTPNNAVVIRGAPIATETFNATQPDAAEYCAFFVNTNAAPGANVIISAYYPNATPDNNTAIFFAGSDTTAVRSAHYSDGDWLNHDGTYGTLSSEAVKHSVTPATDQWADTKALAGMMVNYETVYSPGKRLLGWIAEQVQTVSPGCVRNARWGDKDLLATDDMTILKKGYRALGNALERIEQQESLIAQLTARITALEAVKPL